MELRVRESTFLCVAKHLGRQGSAADGLWLAGWGEWNVGLLGTVFPYPIVNLIRRIPLASHDLSERWRWFPDSTGDYSVRSGYRLLLRGFLGGRIICFAGESGLIVCAHAMVVGLRPFCMSVGTVQWSRRNKLIHEGVYLPTRSILFSILGYLRELDSLSIPREDIVTVGSSLWKTPVDPWARVNFDAGFFADLQAASTGIVIRNSEGLLLGSACFWEENIPCTLSAKALAGV
ncbi:hypothetical protein PVK06_002183 [Gossypium arboreum]|uniref:Uncharacterized protein n=1 Tax=Gossypium arboreum TaxID=29729 RepID=A0ABR0R2X4_GOSAR|nr:hypothetical protein PVK06_002183 [Gossypium arboreum]